MAKKKINYLDISTKELELLKDTYIDLKVKSMNHDELKDFVRENVSLQIKNTIGNDEELEAWQEMEKFFNDEFEKIIQEIKIKMRSKNGEQSDLKIEGKRRDSEDKREEKKLDMWVD
tara:strand:+ start:154 stop:504 length:351 start_codon:yes stop_codon:yes gene_type:complete